MHRFADRLPMLPTALRVALVLFVLAWIFGPYELRSAVPVWVAFLIALGLELNFLFGALSRPSTPRPDRGPQPVDRERYGYFRWPEEESEDELVDERSGLWLPVRRFLVGLGVIGGLALVFWFVESRTGWDSLPVESRAEAQDRFSEEASRIAGKEVRIRCDESGDYVGAVQHADG
ncbi:MAG: hypothetical protein ACREJR_06310, partial [Candidatus Rokuibacteriota bacterium]